MKETMGQIIRRLRKERNLTQEELAEQIGVTFQAISKWEYDTEVLPRFVSGKRPNTPLLCNSERNFYWTAGEWKDKLLIKLNNPAFNGLKENEKFCSILDKVTAM